MGWGVGIVGGSDNLVHFIGTLMAMGCRVTAHRQFWQDERALTRYLDVGYQLPVIYSSHGSEREVADNVDSRITQAPR